MKRPAAVVRQAFFELSEDLKKNGSRIGAVIRLETIN